MKYLLALVALTALALLPSAQARLDLPVDIALTPLDARHALMGTPEYAYCMDVWCGTNPNVTGPHRRVFPCDPPIMPCFEAEAAATCGPQPVHHWATCPPPFQP